DLTYYVLTTLSGELFSCNAALLMCSSCKCLLNLRALFCGLFRLGYQSLGEEYVSIIQVDPSKRRIPSRMRRSTLIFFHTSVPYLLDKVLICIENELEAEAPQMSRTWMPLSHVRLWIQRVVGMLTESQRKSLILSLIFALQQGIRLLYRLHVAVFYITGAFYHIGKRAAGVSYVSICSLIIIKSVLWE
uniref:RING-type E3 ubiquitin transferase n=1 Tax=Sinocyclocheilus anshuiensis TaxID=1608454 RepID=A0A671KQW0_9TELE